MYVRSINLCIRNHVPTTFHLSCVSMHAFSGSPLDAISICLVIENEALLAETEDLFSGVTVMNCTEADLYQHM